MKTPINEPTTTAAEPIVSTGGSGGVSFDDLEAVQSAPSTKGDKKSSPKASVDEYESSEKPTKKDAKPEADEDEAADEEVEVVDEAEDEGKEKKPEPKDAKAKEKPQAKAKTIKVKAGDKDVELAADTPFEVTIDGKAQKVPLQELLSNYSGKVVYDKKFGELDKERKSFQAERTSIQGAVDKFFDLGFKQGDPRAAVEFLAESTGQDPIKVWNEWETAIEKGLEELQALSPEERKARKVETENEYLRKRDESRRADEAKTKERATLQSRVEKVRETHNIPEAEFVRLYKEIKASGKVDPKFLDPELVGDYYAELQAINGLKGLLQEANPDLENQDQIIGELRTHMRAKNFTVEDMRDVIAEVYGSKKSKALLKKLKKTAPVNTARSARRTEDPLNFDDIE